MPGEVVNEEEDEVATVDALLSQNEASDAYDYTICVPADDYTPDLESKPKDAPALYKRINKTIRKIGKHIRDSVVLLFVSFEVAVLCLLSDPEEDVFEEQDVHEVDYNTPEE